MGVDSDFNARDRTASFRVGSPGYAAITGLFEEQRQKEAAAKKAAEEAAKKAVQPPPPPPVQPPPPPPSIGIATVEPVPVDSPDVPSDANDRLPPLLTGIFPINSEKRPALPEIDKGFYDSDEFKNIEYGPAGMAVTYSPYFGMHGDTSIRKRDRAYEAYLRRTGQTDKILGSSEFLERPEPERPRYPGFEEDQPLTESMKKFIAEGKRIDGRKRGDDFLETLDITIGTDRGGMGQFLNAKTPDGIPVLLTSAQKERLAKLKGADSALGNLLGSKTKIKTDAELFSAATGNGDMAETTDKTYTDADLTAAAMQETGELAEGYAGNVPQVTAVRPTVRPGEIQGTTGTQLTGDVAAGTAIAPTTGLDVTAPTAPTGLGQVPGISNITPNITAMDAAQIGAAPQVDMSQIQGTLSPGALATAATQELDERATVQYQLGQLLGSIEEGKPMPAWAAPNVRKVAGMMQARGLGGSSMAAAAMTQAVMESGVVIAAQDAQKYATIQLQNLNNQQQTALANAAQIAGMDKANLSARLQGAVTNAQLLLATETKNLDAQQKADTLSYNALTQAIFKDAAEENARRQFNAKNELQVEEFFAELGSQVETANANRKAATDQFNAGEINAQSQFNAAMRDNREKFNANMQYAIDQSNVQWRRQVNTADIAVQNETNRINAQNLFNASQNALNNLWQKYRDNAAWNFQKNQSYLQRQHEVGIMAMEFANSKELYNQQQKDQLAAGIGNWLALWYANRGS
jgi:hypothetical protein